MLVCAAVVVGDKDKEITNGWTAGCSVCGWPMASVGCAW